MGGAIATLYVEKFQHDFQAVALSSPMHQPYTGFSNRIVCAGANFASWSRDKFIAQFNSEPGYVIGQGLYMKKTFVEDDKSMMTHSRMRFEAIQKFYDQHSEVKVGGVTSHWLASACEASERLLKNTALIKVPVLVLQAGEI